MLHTPSRDILILVTVGVRYLIQELLFEFDLTIENLGQNDARIWSTHGRSLPLLTTNILRNRSTRSIQVAAHRHLTLSIWAGSPSEQSGYTAVHEIEHI